MKNALAVAILFLATLLSGPLLAMAMAQDASDPVLLVIAPPWADSSAIVAQAGAQPVSPFPAPMAELVRVEGDRDGVIARLRSSGAWAIISGTKIASICGVQL